MSNGLHDHELDLFKHVFDHAPDGMLLVDVDGRIRFANGQAERMFGYDRDQLIGQPVELLIPHRYHHTHIHDRASFVAAPHVRSMGSHMEIYGVRRDGSEFPADVSLSPVDTEYGLYVSAAIRDMTARKRLEARVRRSEKIEAVARLAGGIAHEFNNLLTVVIGCTEMALTSTADATARELLQDVLAAGDHAAALTRQFLSFGRNQILRPETLDLNVLVTRLAQKLEEVLPDTIGLSVRLAPDPVLVRADRRQTARVVSDLVANARDALVEGGRIAIATAAVHIPEPRHLEVAPGTYGVVSVEDTGPGVPSELEERVFEPFFTTKGFDKGVGLALASAYGTARQSGGVITFENLEPSGARFTIYLPSTAEAQPPVSAVDTAIDNIILVLESDDAIRSLIAASLRRSGFEVAEATGVREAERLVSAHGAAIRLVIADAAVVDQLRLTGRSIPTLCIADNGPAAPQQNVIAKPFTPSTLVNKVRAMLRTP